jgi:repressor LexA
MPEESLTPKQKIFLDFLTAYREEQGTWPSVREAAEHFGFASPNAAQRYFVALEGKGYLRRFPGRVRGVEVLTGRSCLPLLGVVAAGEPLEVGEETWEEVEVPERFLHSRKRRYALRVKGKSMIEMGILSGDYVIIEENPEPPEGAAVVALVDGAATLKRLYRQGTTIRLQPENADMEPIILSPDQDIKIQGVLIGVLRFLD